MTEMVLRSSSARSAGWRSAVAALATSMAAGSVFAAGRDTCPDLTGHYAVITSGDATAEALRALRLGGAGGRGVEVTMTGGNALSLTLSRVVRNPGPLLPRPDVVLAEGPDYRCEGGALVLKPLQGVGRRTGEQWYEGQTAVRLARSRSGEVVVDVVFSGRQRITLYAYDSARVSVPKLGSGITQRDQLRWATPPEPDPAQQPPEPEPMSVLAVRRLLDYRLLGNLTLGWVSADGDAVRVTLKARREADAAAFEDRLRAAAVNYRVKVPPIWSDRSYHLEVLVWPDAAAAGASGPSRPSPSRVEHELRRMNHPLVVVDRVQADGGVYLATLRISGQDPLDDIIARLKANTQMFTRIELVSESMEPGARASRVAQLKLFLR